MPVPTTIDLSRIVPHGGSQNAAFEEFASQLASHVDVPAGSTFQRNGRGSDLGVECLWVLPNGKKWGWQAKFVTDLNGLKAQADESFRSALKNHPTMERFYICVPFQPSAARGRGKSQQEKLAEYKKAWERLAKRKRRNVTVEWWTPASMNDRLLEIDAHGGRRLYWFGTPTFTHDWFSNHAKAAVAAAGPRYTATLNVGHALVPVLDALRATPEWRASLIKWRADIEAAVRECANSIKQASTTEIAEFPRELIASATTARDRLAAVPLALDRIDQGLEAWQELKQVTSAATDANETLCDGLQKALDAKHGPNASRSKRFREFHAEYQAAFPAHHYDRADETNKLLARFSSWLDSEEVRAFLDRRLLITGVAGIGKTHSLCDSVLEALNEKRYSVLLHGLQFHAGRPAWEQIRGLLGLSGEWSADAMLDALDSAAEASGHNLVIFIDALNESQPRTLWRTDLPQLLEALKSRSHLRLCVSCRNGFVSAIKEDDLALPIFEHPGFAGIEFDACQSFFHHYELEPPVGPLFDPEFSNPLFLKLVCKTLKDLGQKQMPNGWSGFRTVFKALLQVRDDAWKQRHGDLISSAMTRSLEALAVEMARRGGRTLPIPDARQLIEAIGLDSEAALEQLIADEFVMRVPGSGEAGLLAEPADELSFAYERLGDHMQVQSALRSVKPEAPLPPPMVELATKESGYAEALAIQLPEHSHRELLDVVPEEWRGELFAPWLRALEWRDLSTIGDSAQRWLRVLLGQATHVPRALDSAIVLALRPSSGLDGDWFHRTLASLPLGRRDEVWCRYLHEAWERPPATSPVRRLTAAAWNRGAAVSPNVHEAWLRVVCWLFAASDRRVRDYATRSAIRLGELRPQSWVSVCESMLAINDDYVLERVLASAYGTHLRVTNVDSLGALARTVVRLFDEQDRANAVIRDHVRCICDLARQHGVELGRDASALQPPFKSDWPLRIPTLEELAPFKDNALRERYPQLYVSVMEDPGGDFGIYTIPSALEPFQKSLSSDEASRWIFKHAIDLGYTEGCAAYDWHLMSKHGAGRHRPRWAERIGKKYQWIALARLLGRLADHVEAEQDEFYGSNLSAIRLRDMDLSLRGEPNTSEEGAREEHDLVAGTNPDDAKWVKDAKQMLGLEKELFDFQHPTGGAWLPLLAYVSMVDREVRPSDRGFRRQVWLQLRSYLVKASEFEVLWRWARRQNFSGRWMPEGRQIGSRAFIGEYPGGLAFGDNGMPDAQPSTGRFGNPLPVEVTPTTYEVDPEFQEDCSDALRYTMHSPVPQMLKALSWNGRDGFVDANNVVAYVDPHIDAAGPMGCFAQRSHLETFLRANDLSLLWTVLGEKLPGDYVKVKRLDYSHVRGWHRGRLRSASLPVTARG